MPPDIRCSSHILFDFITDYSTTVFHGRAIQNRFTAIHSCPYSIHKLALNVQHDWRRVQLYQVSWPTLPGQIVLVLSKLAHARC